MSRLAGASCKSILYCSPEQPPPTTATRSTPLARPCLVSSVETFLAALAVSFTKRSSPNRKFGWADAAGLLRAVAIIRQGERSHLTGARQTLACRENWFPTSAEACYAAAR